MPDLSRDIKKLILEIDPNHKFTLKDRIMDLIPIIGMVFFVGLIWFLTS